MDESEYGFVAIANELLLRFELPVITNLSECTSQVFVALYEGILGEKHPNIVSVRNKKDEITNVQVIINTLAQDVLHADLSHISGQAIVDGDHVTIRYLLEIFTGLMEYVMEQITTGASTDAEDEDGIHDPDILTQGTISTISDILQEELGTRTHSYATRSRDRLHSQPRFQMKSDISFPSTISNVESRYDSEYSSDSTIEIPHHVHTRNKATILPQDFGKGMPQGTPPRNTEIVDAGRSSGQHNHVSRSSKVSHKGPVAKSKVSSTTGRLFSSSRLPSDTVELESLETSARGRQTRSSWTTTVPAERSSMPASHTVAACTTTVPAEGSSVPAGHASQKPESDSEGEKIKQRVLENESIEKQKAMKQQRNTDADVDSRGGADVRLKAKKNDNLQVEEISSSLSTTSPPSATKNRPVPSSKPEENAFVSLGVRPKPASHPHFQMEKQDEKLDSRSSKDDVGIRHHLHTHHHFHDWQSSHPDRPTISGRGQRASHTLTQPPPENEYVDQMPSDVRLLRMHCNTRMDSAGGSKHIRTQDALSEITRPKDPIIARPRDQGMTRGPPTDDEDECHVQVQSNTRLYNTQHARDFVGARHQDAFSEITRPAKSRLSKLSDEGTIRPRGPNLDRAGDAALRLGQSLPLAKQAVVTKDKPVGYSLRSQNVDKADEVSTVSKRKVAFTDYDVVRNENDDEFELDKDFILKQLKKRLIDEKKSRADDSSEDTDSDISLHSDSVVDYDLTPQAKRHRVYSPKRGDNKLKSSVVKPVFKKNHVHFDDALEGEAKGKFGKIRRSVQKEGAGHLRKTKAMKEVYANHLEQLKMGQKELIEKKKTASELLDKKYREIHQIPKTKKYSAAKKYTKSTIVDKRERNNVKGHAGKRKRSASSSPVLVRNRRPLVIEEDEMLPTVMSEFPMLHVSPHTAHNMWSKQMRQLEQLTKSGFTQSRKTKTQKKMEEAERRQELLLGIMRKELAHNRRMKDIKEKREHEKAMKMKIHEQRQATARARRYYEQFKVRASARMLKRKNREEQIFKKLFEDGLQIQKNRIRELRKYAKEKREEMAVQQQNEIESLENYYSNQFAMLAEAIGQERHDLLVRDNAQAKVMARMKRELRCKMETEIQEFQENLYNDEDREYFRQVEADRMKRELLIAAYKASL